METNVICECCKEPIEDNQGTYWIKGKGGIFSRGIYPDSVVCAHWGKCADVLGNYFDQFSPDEKGESWFWNHLPFRIQSNDVTTNSDRFVYVLKSVEYYKIGITKNVEQRMKHHQTSHYEKLLFVCSCFVTDTPRFEKDLHKTFSEYRGGGSGLNYHLKN